MFCSALRYDAAMLTLPEIHAAVRERLEVVRAAKDEFDRLERALEALGPIVDPPPAAIPAAPYGLKRDGTPRKRPGRPTAAKSAPEEMSLRVVTGGVPAVRDGAEPAYVTQEG